MHPSPSIHKKNYTQVPKTPKQPVDPYSMLFPQCLTSTPILKRRVNANILLETTARNVDMMNWSGAGDGENADQDTWLSVFFFFSM